MIVRSDLARMKENLDSIVGQEIQLTARRGRKRAVTRKGVIEKTYQVFLSCGWKTRVTVHWKVDGFLIVMQMYLQKPLR